MGERSKLANKQPASPIQAESYRSEVLSEVRRLTANEFRSQFLAEFGEPPQPDIAEELRLHGTLPGGRISFARGFGWYRYGKLRLESLLSGAYLVICDVLPDDPEFWSDPFTQAVYHTRLDRSMWHDPVLPSTTKGVYVEGYCQTRVYRPFVINGGFVGLRHHKNPQLSVRNVLDIELLFGGIH